MLIDKQTEPDKDEQASKENKNYLTKRQQESKLDWNYT